MDFWFGFDFWKILIHVDENISYMRGQCGTNGRACRLTLSPVLMKVWF